VHRLLAALLMVVVGSTPIASAVFVKGAESKLPACCRRDGNHGCGMKSAAPSKSGVSLYGARCASYPTAKLFSVNRTAGLAPQSKVTFALALTLVEREAQSRALYHVSYNRAGQKRGPPLSL
jgi:hypothetical protein